jgi:hypothetical protein
MTRSTRTRGAVTAILAAGCLLAPTAMANDANVYIPPAPDTATQQGQQWLESHPAPAAPLPDAHKTANVYVPPAQDLPDTMSTPEPPRAIADAPGAGDGGTLWTAIGLGFGGAMSVAALATAFAGRSRRAHA